MLMSTTANDLLLLADSFKPDDEALKLLEDCREAQADGEQKRASDATETEKSVNLERENEEGEEDDDSEKKRERR